MPNQLNISFATLLLTALALPASAEAPKGSVSFQKDIAPLFVEHCIACHDAKNKKGGYDMTNYQVLLKAGRKGARIVPGKPDESLLAQMMHGDEQPSMPKDADTLAPALLAKVDRWIQDGAKFDGSDPKADLRSLVPTSDPGRLAGDYSVPTPTTALVFSPDGKQLAVAGYYEITFWAPATGQLLHRLPVRSERIHALVYSADGKLLVHAGGTPGRLGEAVLWNAATRTKVRELGTTTDVLFAAAFSPDGRQVAAAGTDRIFRIWDVASGKELAQVENHADWVFGIAFAPGGKQILTASRDKSVKVWDQTTKEPVLTFPGHTDGVYAVGITPDGKVAASVGADRMLRFWTPTGEGKEIRAIGAHGGTVHALAFARSGKVVFTAGADKLAKAWSPADGKLLQTYTGAKDWLYAVAVSADEKWVAAGSWDGEVHVWDAATGKPLAAFSAVPSIALAKATAAAKPGATTTTAKPAQPAKPGKAQAAR